MKRDSANNQICRIGESIENRLTFRFVTTREIIPIYFHSCLNWVEGGRIRRINAYITNTYPFTYLPSVFFLLG